MSGAEETREWLALGWGFGQDLTATEVELSHGIDFVAESVAADLEALSARIAALEKATTFGARELTAEEVVRLDVQGFIAVGVERRTESAVTTHRIMEYLAKSGWGPK